MDTFHVTNLSCALGQAAREPKLGEIDLQGNNWKSDYKIGIFETYIKNETGCRVWWCPLRFWSKMMLAGVRRRV